MELKEAIELIKEMKNNCLIKRDYIDEKAEKKAKAIDTVLQVLTIPDNKDVCFVGGGRTKGRTLTSTYEFGLIVGTKRERVYWEDKIKKEIEELKVKLEDVSKHREKAKEQEEEAVLWCLEIRLDERIKAYEELLKRE